MNINSPEKVSEYFYNMVKSDLQYEPTRTNIKNTRNDGGNQ